MAAKPWLLGVQRDRCAGFGPLGGKELSALAGQALATQHGGEHTGRRGDERPGGVPAPSPDRFRGCPGARPRNGGRGQDSSTVQQPCPRLRHPGWREQVLVTVLPPVVCALNSLCPSHPAPGGQQDRTMPGPTGGLPRGGRRHLDRLKGSGVLASLGLPLSLASSRVNSRRLGGASPADGSKRWPG